MGGATTGHALGMPAVAPSAMLEGGGRGEGRLGTGVVWISRLLEDQLSRMGASGSVLVRFAHNDILSWHEGCGRWVLFRLCIAMEQLRMRRASDVHYR